MGEKTMAQSKTRTKAKSQTSSGTRKWIIRGLIAVSIGLNILFFVMLFFILQLTQTNKYDMDMLQYFTATKLDDNGCLMKLNTDTIDPALAKTIEDDKVLVCVRTTGEKLNGEIFWPETLKGLRFYPSN